MTINFHTKLEAAINEMAKLSSWSTDIANKENYTLSYGVEPYKQQEEVVASDEDEAVKILTDRLISRHGQRDSKPPDAFFAIGLSSMNDLINTIEITDATATPRFNDKDERVLKHPKTARTIENYLNDNPAGYKWNFIITDDIDSDSFDTTNPQQQQMVAKRFGVELKDHITFIKTGSTGDLLKPDMLLHTVGHALFTSFPSGLNAIQNMFDWFYTHVLLNYTADEGGNEKQNIDRELRALSQFMHFKAAKNFYLSKDNHKLRSKALLSVDEAIHEMAGIFVKRNKVRFAPNEYCKFADDEDVVEKAKEIEERVNEVMKSTLDKAVGNIIVD